MARGSHPKILVNFLGPPRPLSVSGFVGLKIALKRVLQNAKRLGFRCPNIFVLSRLPNFGWEKFKFFVIGTRMQFASAFSTNPDFRIAIDEACGAVMDTIDASIDIAFVFFSCEYLTDDTATGLSIEAAAEELVNRLGTDQVIGCSGESIVANQYELQWQPSISIWVASLDSPHLDSCHLEFRSLGDDAAFEGWEQGLTGTWADDSVVFTVADPFSFPMDVFLQRMNEDRSGVPVMGGIASGATQPGEARLILGTRVFDRGAVLVRMDGSFDVDCVVSQGCRPIGHPFVITKAQRNEIYELGGRSALSQLHAIFQSLPTHEKQAVNQGLQIGRVISEYIDRPKQGDFLIRNLLQIDEATGMIAIAEYVRLGQTVQFQIRDQDSAHAELKFLLSDAVSKAASPHQAALMFNCNGRGTRMFSGAHHDSGLLREVVGSIPTAGFFAAGEIGPVSEENFLHGFTSSIALFRESK